MGDDITPLTYAVSAIVCALTAIGLRRSYQKDETWLPCFAASTVFKAFVFWVSCVFVPLWIRAYHNGDNMVEVGMYLLFPMAAFLGFFASTFTYVLFRLVPNVRRRLMPANSKTRAVRFANVTLLCVGLLIAGIVAVTG
jgi:hypothetical protein